MDGKLATPDHSIVEIAERQHGAISIVQLRHAGLSDDAVRGRTLAGRLHRIHRGVYAVGHRRLSPRGRWFAAVLAVGRGPSGEGDSVLGHWGAAVSHRSAAQLWELLPATGGPVDVIVDGMSGRAERAGIRIHHSRTLKPADVTSRDGIPVTSPARTIADLRRAVAQRAFGAPSPRQLRRVDLPSSRPTRSRDQRSRWQIPRRLPLA